MAKAKKNYADQTTDSDEIRHFDTIGDDWWDEQGTFRALHWLTPTRVRYIRQHIARFRGKATLSSSSASLSLPLAGIKAVDIGCGGGLLAEPLTRLGAEVTGIDMSKVAIAAAKDHADNMGLDIQYRHISAEQLAAEGTGYDLVIASEVIEHVSDRSAFLTAMAALGRGGKAPGIAIITTISSNMIATALAKYAAEYLLRLAPPGTHDAAKFVSPQTLRAEAKAAGIHLDDITGIRPSIRKGFDLGGPPIINYAAAGLIL